MTLGRLARPHENGRVRACMDGNVAPYFQRNRILGRRCPPRSAASQSPENSSAARPTGRRLLPDLGPTATAFYGTNRISAQVLNTSGRKWPCRGTGPRRQVKGRDERTVMNLRRLAQPHDDGRASVYRIVRRAAPAFPRGRIAPADLGPELRRGAFPTPPKRRGAVLRNEPNRAPASVKPVLIKEHGTPRSARLPGRGGLRAAGGVRCGPRAGRDRLITVP